MAVVIAKYQSSVHCARGLWRKRWNHFNSEFLQCASHFGELPPIESFPLLRVLKEMAGPITVKRTEQTSLLNDFTQSDHDGSSRFGLHQLGVVDLTGGVIENHDQVYHRSSWNH